MTPSPLAVAVEQGTATFRCQHSFADDINWLVNGTSLNRVHSPDVYSSVQFQGSVTTYTLSIGTLVEYNETTIECVAIFLDGSPSLLTAPVTLFVQGLFTVHMIVRYYSLQCMIEHY